MFAKKALFNKYFKMQHSEEKSILDLCYDGTLDDDDFYSSLTQDDFPKIEFSLDPNSRHFLTENFMAYREMLKNSAQILFVMNKTSNM
jgi:hypothetical protein